MLLIILILDTFFFFFLFRLLSFIFSFCVYFTCYHPFQKQEKRTITNSQKLPKRGVLTLAPHSLDKFMESSKKRPLHNKWMESDKQKSLFLDNDILMPLFFQSHFFDNGNGNGNEDNNNGSILETSYSKFS